MNPGSKRLRLSPSKHPGPSPTAGPPSSSPPRFSHDALPLSLAAGSRVEEEEEGYLVVEEDATDSSLIITMEDSQLETKRRRPARSRKRKMAEEESEGEVEIDRQLDQSLETKSRQHNLTTVNVKNIIHEVITNEHVVAMMKAAINETEARPPFEPKMTRSKLKEVVERGVVIPAWNISPIKKPSDVRKPPQFVDILLAEEDSSDEEYRPDDEEEDETAEDTFQESDLESLAPSPRGSRGSRLEEDGCSPWQMSRSSSRHGRRGLASMGPPPLPRAQPPKAVTDSSFLEKLHAVEEELAVCMKPFQPLSESEDHVGLISYRTRSKRPLRDVPLGQLEAELRAPDITPDMYDSSSAHEDREWTDWLRGLMNTEMDNEEECDDEDDPEYNFLADIDEPDLEDYRDDKAVRITKKEVNQLMEELFQTLKEDLAGQEVEDEGREEEEDAQEESHHADMRPEEEEEEEHSGPIRELRTVKQQLAFLRRKRLSQQTHTHTHTPHPEPHTLRLAQPQRLRLQQQLQQHVQLLTQIHLLSSPVAQLHSEAETTRQFLFELDLLAQRGELLMSAGYHGYRSIFRASNLQPARRLLEELQQNPISYQPKLRPPDSRGYMRCHPIMPAELAWLFATRSVFLHPELLPCASLDPALYCPRRTCAFTAAEDCLLVLGLRNMEGSVDPPKMVSQFLVRKSLVQVRRRILQCCRPGFPDNLVKAYRYQGLLEAMPVACRHVHPAQQRPPVEREEHLLPLWLARSLPVLQLVVSHYNSPCGSPQTLPLPHRSAGARHSHMSIARAMSKSTSKSCSFPPGTRYPERLPRNLDLKRIGFVLLQQPDRHTPDSAPLPDGLLSGSAPLPDSGSMSSSTPSPLGCPRMLKKSTSTVSLTTTEKIQLHFQTLIGLRRRQDGRSEAPPFPPQIPTHSQVEAAETKDINGSSEEEEEEQSEVCLALSESSSEELLEPPEVEPEQEQRRNPDGAEGGEPREEEEEEPEDAQREEEEEGDDARRQQQEQLFAQEYLLRVCAAVHRCPDVAEQLLQVLDGFLAAPASPERLYGRLRGVLGPWPQLLWDFAAFLTRRQARRCGLLLEQQLFQRSRQFLWRLGRSLGEGSVLYHQVVSVLQRSSASTPEDLEKLAPLLQHHPDLQEELRGLFQQFHHRSSLATANRDMKAVFESTDGMTKKEECEETDTGRDAEEEEEAGPPVMARKVSVVPSGETVVAWTREADRAILVACQQRGASWDTFTHVSAQLGDRTAQQVSLRFQDLMRLFYSAFQNAGS